MLSCWVAHPRPRGAPRMTYGRSVGKALDTFGLDHNKWPELAADRLAWRAMLRSGVRRAVPTCTARRLRPPPPCPSRSHTRAQATHGGHQRRHPELHAAARCDDAARREDKDLPQTHFVFPNQTPTQTVSLIPTPRLYTKDRILACRPYVPLGTGRTTPVRGYTLYYIYVLVPDIQ